MSARVGIELSPVACRIVELDGHPFEPGKPLVTRVRAYAILPPASPETDSHLAALRGRSAAVVIWGAASQHRPVVVTNGAYEKMRAEAIASASEAGVDTQGTIADISTASTAVKGATRQPVVLALANGMEVAAQLRPLIEARIRIRSVISPADALLGLARSRKAFAIPGGIEAYVALDEVATCVALIRDGSLLDARELPWGYRVDDGTLDPTVSRRDDLAVRLVMELTDFLAAVGAGRDALTQVSICGGLPELRTMTVPLMERLDVEVEALDSMFGIDPERLPEPADEFRERASELKLAWSAAADWNGPINLLRHRRRRERAAILARAAVVAGVVAGLGAGVAIEQSRWWQSTAAPKPIAKRISAPATPTVALAPPRAGAPQPSSAPPSVATVKPVAPPTTIAKAPPTPTPAPPKPVVVPPAIVRGTMPGAATPSVAANRPVAAPSSPAPSVATAKPVAPPATSAKATLPPPPSAATPPVANAKPVVPPPTIAKAPPAVTPPSAASSSTTSKVTPAPPSQTPPKPVVVPPAIVRTTPPVAATPSVPSKPSVAATSTGAATPLVAPPSPSKLSAAPPPVAPPRVSPPVVPPRAAQPPVVTPPVARANPPAATPATVAPGPSKPLVAPKSDAVPPSLVSPTPQVTAPRPATPPPVAPSAARIPTRRAAPAGKPAPAEPPPLPLDATLGTILYSPDRKLAIVNGRIVGIGDDVNGARIVDITPGTVLLRDGKGRLRSLTLASGASRDRAEPSR